MSTDPEEPPAPPPFVNEPEMNETPTGEDRNAEEPEKPKSGGNGMIYIWLSLIMLVIGVIIISIMLTVVKDNQDDSNPAPSYTLATDFPPCDTSQISDPQERLNLLREVVGKNNATAFYLIDSIPDSASSLSSSTSANDPVKMAANWVVREDQYHLKSELIPRFALAVLYYNNGGDSKWYRKEGWLTSTSLCEWHGIKCCKDYYPELNPRECIGDMANDIVEIDLNRNNLDGEIPAAVALLTALHHFWLSNNNLQGELNSTVIKEMKSLDALYIQNNLLSGPITGDLRANGQLDTLLTHGNRFSGDWPKEFCPSCVSQGLCISPPIQYTLDCLKMMCPMGFSFYTCCSSEHCISD